MFINLLLGPSPIMKSSNLSKKVLFGLIIGLGSRVLACDKPIADGGGGNCDWFANDWFAFVCFKSGWLDEEIVALQILLSISLGNIWRLTSLMFGVDLLSDCKLTCCWFWIFLTLRWIRFVVFRFFGLKTDAFGSDVLLPKGVLGKKLESFDGDNGGDRFESDEKRSNISLAFLYVSFSFTSSS